MITINADTASASKALQELAKLAPKAVLRAINDTAFKVMAAEKAEMQAVFDRPTKFIINGVQTSKARKEAYFDSRTGRNVPEMTALVGGTDFFNSKGDGDTSSWDRTIAPHVEGGTRLQKAMERRLTGAGLLPGGWYVVPGRGMRLNQYGNISGGAITAILSWVGAMGQYAGDNTNKRDRQTKRKNQAERRGESFFVARPGNPQRLTPGIYRTRKGSAPVPMLIFVQSVSYSQRLDWYGVASKVIDAELARQAKKALMEVLS